MAIALECFNVLIPITTVERCFNGGIAEYRRFVGPSYFQDEHLTRAGFMNSVEANQFLCSLHDGGIPANAMAMVSSTSTESEADWLSIGKVDGVNACWLTTELPGDVLSWRSPMAFLCPVAIIGSISELLGKLGADVVAVRGAHDETRDCLRLVKDDVVLDVEVVDLEDKDKGGLFIHSEYGRIFGAPDDFQFRLEVADLLMDVGAESLNC